MSPSSELYQGGYQEPQHVSGSGDCFFYHSTELPGLGLQVGHWDLREDVDRYLGKVDFAGKRVIDVGTASGYLAFEMEKRGADVVAFDRLLSDARDEAGLVPFFDYQQRFGQSIEESMRDRFEMQRQLQNSFWLTHRLRESKVKLYCANAYDDIREIGLADYVFFGCMLLHLRDPLLALSLFAPLAKEKLIITEMHEEIGAYKEAPVMFLRPNINDVGNRGTWWYMTPTLLRRYLEILGFRTFEFTTHKARSVGDGADVNLFTLVATR